MSSTLSPPPTHAQHAARRPAPGVGHLLVAAAVSSALGLVAVLPLTFGYLSLAVLVLAPLGLVATDSTFDEGTRFYAGLGGACLVLCAGLVVATAVVTSRLVGRRATGLWWLACIAGFLAPFALRWIFE